LWNDQDRAKKILQEKTRLENALGGVNSMDQRLEDVVMLLDLADEEEDIATEKEAEKELQILGKEVTRLETERLLGGDADGNNAFLEVHSGAGGTESQDWAAMLLRMYTRWAENKGFNVSLIAESRGEEAGIKSATIEIKGDMAYGLLKTESGVHRLVRISPFDSQNRRHTSFSSVFVYPEVDENIDIIIEEKDLRIDTYRASGAGGQHVNTTDSAVRITHVPTNIVVSCQQQRSQHKNKAQALKMLKARLYENEIQKQEAEKMAVENTKTDNGWGSQIRSYVLHPYRMVKDLRTQVETGNAEYVLDGDLDMFIQAALSARASNRRAE
jgi:peptide chain release factor 2